MSLSVSKTKNSIKIAESGNKSVYMDNKNENGMKEINGNNFLPYIDMKDYPGGVRIFYSGGTGSGKTYLCTKILQQIKPKHLYLFSSIDDDDYKEFKNMKRIDLNEILENNPELDIHQVYEYIEKDAVCIFDDIVSFGTKLSKPYLELRSILLTKGRHKGQSTFVIEQQGQNYNKTRDVLLNSQFFVMFPKNNYRSFKSMASNYLGLMKNDIENIRNLPGRYVFINKHYPMYVVSEKEIRMI